MRARALRRRPSGTAAASRGQDCPGEALARTARLQDCPVLIHLYLSVIAQYYEAEVVSEYVIKGNTAVLKCNIPSFVADFVRVENWLCSDGTVYMPTTDYGNAVLIPWIY